MKVLHVFFLLVTSLSCTHKIGEKKKNELTINITLADSKCLVPVVFSNYYFESYNKADKKKKKLNTTVLNQRLTSIVVDYPKYHKFVMSIKKQPDSETLLKRTVYYKDQKTIDLYLSFCD